MRRSQLDKKFPNAKISDRHFGSVIDLSRHLFCSHKDYVRQRAMRFMVLAGAVEIVMIAIRFDKPKLDEVAFRLSKDMASEAGAGAWKKLAVKIARNTGHHITPDFVRSVLENGIPVGKRGRPAKSPAHGRDEGEMHDLHGEKAAR